MSPPNKSILLEFIRCRPFMLFGWLLSTCAVSCAQVKVVSPKATVSDTAPSGASATKNPDADRARAEATPPPVTPIQGEFLLERAEGYEPLAGVAVELKFRSRTMSFFAGCNSHSGSFSVGDGLLTVGGFVSTRRGCAPNRDQDRWFYRFLSLRPSIARIGHRLTITSGAVTLVFLDAKIADPDRALVGPSWKMQEFLNENGRWNAGLRKVPYVEFFQDGTFYVSTGCNAGRGTFTADEMTITFEPIAYTKVECVDELAQEAETAVKAVLSAGKVSVEIERARLTLRRGKLGLIAQAE